MELNALVVEDNASSLERICDALQGAGISAMATRSPLHASELLDRRKFDGIFLDLAMPGLNPAALSRQIRRSTRNATTPIIVVGEQDRPGPYAIKEAFAAGAQFYLAKPLDRAKLLHLVNSTQGSLMRERLRSQTVEMRTAVSCRTGSGEYSGVSTQVNETGIVFQFDGKLHSGDFVRLSFRLPRTECKVETTGTIMRVMRDAGQQRAACRFDNLSSASLQAIHDFVTSSAGGGDSGPAWGGNEMPAAESLKM
jgi:CheY-like chemotaxis protein